MNIRVGPAGYTSPTLTVPAGITDIDVDLDSAAWDTTTGTWSWAADYRRPDGSWNVLIGQGHLADPNAPDNPIGERGKDGSLPRMGYSATTLDPATGEQVPVNLGGMVLRARLWFSTEIRLSVNGTLS